MKQIRSFFSVLLLGISLMLVSVSSFSADLQKGLDAYNRGDYLAAIREWRPLANQGMATAQRYLGWMYDNGIGVVQSDAESLKWYRKAAEQGNAEAQEKLGWIYQRGDGAPRNLAEAVI